MTQEDRVRLPRVRALDGLRGVAVVAVLLFHDDRLTGGYLGVDLFFVLSGFLITSLLLAEFEQHGGIRLRRFYARRARRLLPALGLVLAGVAVYATVWARPDELPRIRGDGFATMFYFANWREILTKQSYWDAFTAPSPLQHMWSLSIEEQFYAIWPLIVLGTLAVRRSARAVLTVALALAGACAAFTVVAAQHNADQRLLYYSTMTRAPALLMGAAFAAVVAMRGHVRSRRGRILVEVAALAGVAYLAEAWTHQAGDGLSLYRGPLLLCGLAAVAVIAAAAHPARGPVARALAAPPLVGLGLISYGLYLFHWPVYLVVTQARTGLSGWTLFGERAAVSIAIAIVSYRLIEQPIRHGALRPTRAIVALGTATAVVAASIVVTTRVTPLPITSVPVVSVRSAAPDASQASAASAASAANTASIAWPRPVAPLVPPPSVRGFLPPGDWSRLTNTCAVNQPLPRVRKIRAGAAPRVLMIGDSVACFLGAAFDMQQVGAGVITLNRARLGCPLATESSARTTSGTPLTVYPPCTYDQQRAIETFDPDVAVLLVGGPDIDEAQLGDGSWVTPCGPGFAPWYEAAARQAIGTLSSTGAKVVVVTIVHPPGVIDIGPGIVLPKSYSRDVDCENQSLRRVVASEPQARLLDLDAYVCPDGRCRTSIDGITLRTDGRHFQGPAASLIASWLLPRVLRLADLAPGTRPRDQRSVTSARPRAP